MCVTCPTSIPINITSDQDLNLTGCVLEEDETCSLVLRIDYTSSNNSFALLSGSAEAVLILTNGEPQVTEATFIWFDEIRVQRMATMLCFAESSCGVDLIKRIYREEFRLFEYKAIQNTLATQLYTSTGPITNLTCLDPSGSSVSCTDGFCRSITDGSGLAQYSSCVKKKAVSNPYGVTITKSTMADLGGEQTAIIFTCNKPMCNSKENTKQVLQELIDAKLIPQPTISTTTPQPTISTTAPRCVGSKFLSNETILLISFLFLFTKF